MTGRGYGKKGDIWDLKDMRVVHFSDKWEKSDFLPLVEKCKDGGSTCSPVPSIPTEPVMKSF